jgi:two-component system sensor histidine kinase/response regulator
MTSRVLPTVKFLLVDDLEENLVALTALLERDDLELLKARSGREALELLLVHDVALALIDVQMPDIDGFELAELMRGTARTRTVPIIFVTAGASEEHRIFKGYDAGAVDFLHKPIDQHILRHKTETFFQLERQRLQLAETLRLNETFVAAVGHDLRNPLSAIMTAAQILEMTATDDRTRLTVSRLRSSGKRMSAIIDDLFDLARVRLGGGISIEPHDTDLSRIVHRVVSEHQQAHPGRKLEVQIEGALAGRWDERRLEQVLSNLIGNAERHGAPDAAITIRAAAAVDGVVFSVHNRGAIAPELLPVLFDPFRSGREKSSREGLGLGLFIVHHVIEAHGGSIEVTSTAEVGTKVRVQLPRHSERSSGRPPPHRE